MTTHNTPATASDEGLPEPAKPPAGFEDWLSRSFPTLGCSNEEDRLVSWLEMAWRTALAAKDAELTDAVEANNMKDLQVAELRERLAELRDIAEQLIACHDEPLCPAVAVAKERIAALAAKGEAK